MFGSSPTSITSTAPLSLVVKVLPCKQGSLVRFHQGAPVFIEHSIDDLTCSEGSRGSGIGTMFYKN